ncbi:MAG: hypothetical protein Q9170_008344 [Blastenia crenularia]
MASQHQCLTTAKALQTPSQSRRGKRKRTPSPTRQKDDTRSRTPTLPLTRPNLLALSEVTQPRSIQADLTYPSPYDAMVYPTPSAGKASTAGKSKEKAKTATSGLAADAILDIYNIHLGRNKGMPNDLNTLVQNLKTPREPPITPNSKWVKDFKASNPKFLEPTELYAMIKHLIYDPQWFPGDTEGEAMVAMELDQQWTAEVPKPPGFTDDKDLQDAMEKFGLPPRAKPDVNHGYNASAFPGPLLTRVKALPEDLLVGPAQPWMPWQTTQWKTAKGQQAKAEQQTRRDTSTSIECLHRFFDHKHRASDPPPSPAATCVFSLQVYDEYCRYRVHWRRVDEHGNVSYEGDELCSAFFSDDDQIYRVRSCVLNVLNWARGPRLDTIKRKLEVLATARQAPATPSTPQRNVGASPYHQPGPSRALHHSPPTPSDPCSKRARESDSDRYEDDLA